MTKKICQVCGKEISPESKRVKYCSDECRKKGRAQVQRLYHDSLYKAVHIKPQKKKKVSLIDEYLKAQANGEKLSYGYWMVERERRAKEQEGEA